MQGKDDNGEKAINDHIKILTLAANMLGRKADLSDPIITAFIINIRKLVPSVMLIHRSICKALLNHSFPRVACCATPTFASWLLQASQPSLLQVGMRAWLRSMW